MDEGRGPRGGTSQTSVMLHSNTRNFKLNVTPKINITGPICSVPKPLSHTDPLNRWHCVIVAMGVVKEGSLGPSRIMCGNAKKLNSGVNISEEEISIIYWCHLEVQVTGPFRRASTNRMS